LTPFKEEVAVTNGALKKLLERIGAPIGARTALSARTNESHLADKAVRAPDA